MKNNQHIAEILLSMDAAEQSAAPDPDRRENDLRQILETNPSVSVLPAVPRPGRRWKTLALAGSTVAATAALIFVPALSGETRPLQRGLPRLVSSAGPNGMTLFPTASGHAKA